MDEALSIMVIVVMCDVAVISSFVAALVVYSALKLASWARRRDGGAKWRA